MTEKFKCEKEIRDFFGSEVFKFHILDNGVAEFETVKTMWDGDDMIEYRVELFVGIHSFRSYDTFNELLEPMQIYKVSAIKEGSGWYSLYRHELEDYTNN